MENDLDNLDFFEDDSSEIIENDDVLTHDDNVLNSIDNDSEDDDGDSDSNSDDSDDNDNNGSDDNNDNDDEDDDEESDLSIIAEGLSKAGILELGENTKIKTEEDFIETFKTNVEKKALERLEEMAIETHGEEGSKIIKELLLNKVPVREYLSLYNAENSVENADLSIEKNQETIIRLYLSETGLDEEEIEDTIAISKDKERLEEVAKKYHSKLLTSIKQKRELLVEQAKSKEQERVEKEQKTIDSYSNVLKESVKKGEIKGYPIKANESTELLKFASNKSVVLKNGSKLTEFEYALGKMKYEDPEAFLAVARLVQKNLDLNPVKKSAVSKETNSMFKKLSTKQKTSSKKSENYSTILSSSLLDKL